MVYDPVCLTELDPLKAKAVAEYKGRSYYFCSVQCKEKFLAQPETFTDKEPGMRFTVGVMGSADSEQGRQMAEIAYALGEFAIAYDEGKLIGVLEGSGGITEKIPDIVASFGDKDTGARLVYDADPQQLVARLAQVYTTEHYKHPSCFCHESSPAG